MTARKRILVVDDDVDFSQALGDQLMTLEDFDVRRAGNGAAALELATTDPFDAIILDVGLPDMDGRDVCRLLRRKGVKVPIVMLTVAASDADTILGLDCGANDYIAKPCRMPVLVARLRAQLRQHERSEHATFAIGPYRFSPAIKTLIDSRNNARIHLTEKEAAILRCLVQAGGRVVPRDILLRDVFGYRPDITTHTLETHVYRLRQMLEADPGNPAILISQPDGYAITTN